MKIFFTTILASLAIFSINSCAADETSEETQEGTTATSSSEEGGDETTFSSDLKNEITSLTYEDSTHSFDQNYVYANYNSMYQSYRIMYLNYDKSEDSDYGSRTGSQEKIVIGLFSPEGDKFEPGKYTWEGNENGMNRISAQVETADGLKGCNYAGFENESYVDVQHVTNDEIIGEFYIIGKGFEIQGSFNAKHESVN